MIFFHFPPLNACFVAVLFLPVVLFFKDPVLVDHDTYTNENTYWYQ